MNHETKLKILNLFDTEIPDVKFTHKYQQKEFFEAFCSLLKGMINKNNIDQLTSYYYSIQEYENVNHFFYDCSFIIGILGTKFQEFSYILPLQKYFDFLSSIILDEREWIDDECPDCFGEGEFVSEACLNEGEEDLVNCSGCNGTGKAETYNNAYNCIIESQCEQLLELQPEYENVVYSIINKTIHIILRDNLHPNIESAFPAYKVTKSIKNF